MKRGLYIVAGLAILIASTGFFPYPALASVGFFQSTTCNGNATPLNSTNFGSTVVAGDLIVVTITDDGGVSGSITGLTDTGGNTYHLIANSAAANTGTQTMWYAVVTTGGSSFHTIITFNTSSAGRVTCVAQEFNGFTGTPTFDKVSAYNTGTSVSALSLTSGTLTQASELIVGSFSHYSTASAFSLGTGYTNLGTVSQANAGSAQESKLVAVNTAVTAGATIAASREWTAYVATFYDAGGGGGGGSSPTLGNTVTFFGW